jgi:hypothetical protein
LLRRGRGCPDALDGQLEGISRVAVAHVGILDGASGQAGLCCQHDRRRDGLRVIAISVFQIAADRQIGGRDDGRSMDQRRLARNLTHVAKPERECMTGAGGRQRLGTERCHHAG